MQNIETSSSSSPVCRRLPPPALHLHRPDPAARPAGLPQVLGLRDAHARDRVDPGRVRAAQDGQVRKLRQFIVCLFVNVQCKESWLGTILLFFAVSKKSYFSSVNKNSWCSKEFPALQHARQTNFWSFLPHSFSNSLPVLDPSFRIIIWEREPLYIFSVSIPHYAIHPVFLL